MSIRPFNAVVQSVLLLPRLGWPALAIVVLLAAGSWGADLMRALARLTGGLAWWLPLAARLPGLAVASLLAPTAMVMALDRLADRPVDVWRALRDVGPSWLLLLVINIALALPSLPFALVAATPVTRGVLLLAAGLVGVLIEALLTPLFAVIVMERRPLMAAVRRALQLNRGRRLAVIAALLIHAAGYLVLVLSVSLAVIYIGFGSPLPPEGLMLLDRAGRALCYGIGSMVGAILAAVLYRRLCEAGAGVVQTDIDEVFG